MSSFVPTEFTHSSSFRRIRQRFDCAGTRVEPEGTMLLLKCRGCGGILEYDWLIKRSNETWTGEFGTRFKKRLGTNKMHKNCIDQNSDNLKQENQRLHIEIDRLKTQLVPTTTTTNITNNNNIVIVNLPAVTRIGSMGVPLMCSDIPYPDEKTVQALLNNPEGAVSGFVIQRYFNSDKPSISAPDPLSKRLRVVQRDNNGNHWVEVPLDSTVDNLVYKTLDALDDEFDAMKHKDFKDWKRREGLTAHIGFDRTEAYQKMQNDVVDVLKTHGIPYQS